MASHIHTHMHHSEQFHKLRQTSHAEAIEFLVVTYYAKVFDLAHALLDDAQEAEDVAQETFIAANRQLAKFRGESSPKTWLFAIASNLSRSRLRKRYAYHRLQQTLQNIQAVFGRRSLAGDMEDAVISEQLDERLWDAVDDLSENHRTTIILRYAQGLPIAEIAEIMQVKEGTVHSRLYYAHRRLKGYLTEAEDKD